VYEMIDGSSLRGQDLGRQLGTSDYVFKSIGIGFDALFLYGITSSALRGGFTLTYRPATSPAGVNSRPMFTTDWQQLLSERYGVDNVQLVSPRNPIQGLPRVGSAQKTDPYHAFTDIVDNFAPGATPTALPNASLYQLEGSLNRAAGRFEWISQDGNVTHRLFVPGGTLNGVPITR
jgi:hypothetical protein